MGGKHLKHVPLLTCLIYLSAKGVLMVSSIYMPKSPYKTLISLSLVSQVLQRFKSPIEFGTKNALSGQFWAKIKIKTVVIFEISTIESV